VLDLSVGALQTLTFLGLVFGSQATLYAIRQRRRRWGSRPSLWLFASSVTDVVIAVILAAGGIAMTSLPLPVIAGLFAAALVFAVVLDAIKIPIFAHLRIT
jgi:H+-transporting ATPase